MALISELGSRPPSVAHRTGTTPYMSIHVLRGFGIHSAADDIESFFYVLLFICLEYSGPGRARDWDMYKTDVRFWIEGDDLRSNGAAKSDNMHVRANFKSVVLDNLPQYFKDLRGCLDAMRLAIFIHPENEVPIPFTHQGFVRILEARLQETFNETVKEDLRPEELKTQVTTSKRKRVTGANDFTGGGMESEDRYTEGGGQSFLGARPLSSSISSERQASSSAVSSRDPSPMLHGTRASSRGRGSAC
ncbi:hypothetical protein AX17_006843 [Amanita inopinata Kibby_2008]|nr:hypothetical protein AX17_006843 [Amanita inopinata Kibby_2008]